MITRIFGPAILGTALLLGGPVQAATVSMTSLYDPQRDTKSLAWDPASPVRFEREMHFSIINHSAASAFLSWLPVAELWSQQSALLSPPDKSGRSYVESPPLPTPLPSSLLMMLSGLGLAGLMLRKKQKPRAAA